MGHSLSLIEGEGKGEGAALSRALPSALRRRLLAWWDAAHRDLPWRFVAGSVDPYRVWVSEVMLQQTQVATVIPYYRRFVRRFPSIQGLARAEEEQVLAAWSGLGYYTRARNLHRAAREAIARHGGLPKTLEELRKLPGFGPYTAGAVASIAFGLPVAAVDGNVGRVLSRLFIIEGDPHSTAFRVGVRTYAEALVAPARGRPGSGGGRERPGDINQALMELGALVCRPGTPRCERCPVKPLCGARKAGRERDLPLARRRAARERLTLAVGVCRSDGRVLLVRRPAKGLFGGMWAPPTVELRQGEDAGAAISSAIRREPSVRTGGFTDLGTVERALTHRTLELRVFAATMLRPPKGEGWRLADAAEMEALAVPVAMRLALRQAGISAPVASRTGRSPSRSGKNRGGGIGTRREKG
jgi:A/G-specific adenine glycosylase